MKKERTLSSIEVRTLMMDTLSYEGNDIDSEGKNFKMYGYCGTQSDLFRLMEGLAIKREIIENSIPLRSAAWGGSGLMLHPHSTTNFDYKDIQLIYEQFHVLLNQGVIAPGAIGNYGPNLPNFHVTDYGLKCLEEREILPYDMDGYLTKIKSVPGITEWVEFYIKEALQCYNLSAEDKETYSRMEAEIEELTNSIERQQRAERREQELSKPVNSPITGKPYKDEPQGEVKTGRASDEYKKAMLTALRSNFRQVSNVLQEGVDADGGYLVPEEYDHRLIDVLTEENIMRGIATKITTSGEHKINIAATKPAAAWIEEGEALSFGNATFEQKILDAHKLHVAIKITEELLYDNAFGLENYIITEFGKALANAEEDAFLNGDGVGKPTGIFDKTKGGESIGTLTAALKSDDVLDLIYKLKRPYRKNASFIMNDATLAQIRKLKDNNGQYLWQPSYQANEPDKILGYNIRTSAFAPTDAIAFGDYKYYNIGDRGSRSFKQLNELFAGNGMIGYVAKERVDGLLILPEAVKILGLKADTTTTATK